MNNKMTFPGGSTKETIFENAAPGVELIVDDERNDLLSASCRRLIGAMHRRMTPKSTQALQGNQARTRLASMADHDSVSSLQYDRIFTVPSRGATSWGQRLDLYSEIVAAAENATPGSRCSVRVEPWEQRESAVLVDGSPTPACLVDIAVLATAFVEPLRAGEQAAAVIHPQPLCEAEAVLWSATIRLCQDRLGIERGMLTASSGAPHGLSNVPTSSTFTFKDASNAA